MKHPPLALVIKKRTEKREKSTLNLVSRIKFILKGYFSIITHGEHAYGNTRTMIRIHTLIFVLYYVI